MAILGLDIGTTGCKSTVMSEDGRLIAKSYREYSAVRNSEKQTLDGNELWQSVMAVIRDSASQSGDEIRAIGISSFGEAFVPVDRKGNALYEIMLYTDCRGEEECLKLSQAAGKEEILYISGVAPHSMYSLPKMMWFKNHCPKQYAKTYKLLLMEDFIIYRLTGNAVIDYSLAARTMAFDIREKTWSDKLLQLAGIDVVKLSQPVLSGTVSGTVKKDIAAGLGLSVTTVVVTGGHDQVCSAVGVEALAPGISVDGTGTVECITPVFGEPLTNEVMSRCGYACVPHAVDGLYVTYAFSFTGGALLKWFRDNLFNEEAKKAEENGQNIYAILDSRIGETPSKLLVLPHFAGAATPYMDNSSVGAIVGLGLETDALDIYRGILEGVTYEMQINLDCLKEAGIEIHEMRATGGGAYSAPWLQMKADILGKRMISYQNCEAGTVGSIALAAVALGDFSSLSEAVKVFSKPGREYIPREGKKEDYRELYESYKKLYPAVKQILKIK